MGNSELSYDLERGVMRAGIQPQIGDSFAREGVSPVSNADIYQGFEVGNEDLH